MLYTCLKPATSSTLMNTNKYECCQQCNINMTFLYYQQQDLILVDTQENINLLRTTRNNKPYCQRQNQTSNNAVQFGRERKCI